MKKRNYAINKAGLYSSLTGGLAVLVLSFFLVSPDPVESKFKELSTHPLPRRTFNEAELEKEFKSRAESKIAPGRNLGMEEMAYLVRKRAGQQIDRLPSQFTMLEFLMRDLQRRDPGQWVENLHQILGAAFPNQEQELFKLSEAMYKYQKQYQENSERWSRLSAAERQAEVWKARRETFGSKADEIWAAEIKLKAVSDTLKQIEDSPSSTLQTKLEMMRASLQENFGNQYNPSLQSQRAVFLERLIRACQSNLAEMTPPARRSALWHLRQTMGLDENALKRWEALDAERSRRWESGKKYLDARQVLTRQYSGHELENKLDDLRARQFGAEAETIKSEEASGYYRYQKNRDWGVE